MYLLRRSSVAIALLALCAACADDPTNTTTPPEPDPKPAPTPIGVYELTLSGIGTDQMTSSVKEVRPALANGLSASMTNAGTGLVLEQVSSNSFIDGTRTGGGQRYITFTYRVRNGTGVTLNNVTLMMANRPASVAGTPFSAIRKLDNTDAGAAVIGPQIAPTGATVLGSDFVTMQGIYPDVLQVLTEAETAAIVLPGDVNYLFPYGFMVRSALTNANRTLVATADPNQYDGLVTIALRVPLQSTGALDVFSITFNFLAVTDTETRLTESIEESQDTGAVRRLRERAVALGATTVTVLNGSSATDAAVPDYPGQRQICTTRTAGTAGSPTNFITTPAGYTQLMIVRPSETVDPCAAYFRGGSPERPSTNVPFTVSVKAMDRYGNVKTGAADTVHLTSTGPPASYSAAAALVSGSANQVVSYSDYGTSQLTAVGRRLRGSYPILVAGVTRTWTASQGTTDWHTPLNWFPNAVPMSQDSVLIPLAAPLDPVIASNVAVRGVTVENGATISLMAFDLTASANVFTGTSGGITNTSGRLFLAGTAATVEGRVPVLRVTGTYSLSGNLTARAPIQVDAGRLTASAFRLQADGN